MGHKTVTIDIDDGVTPFTLRCKTEGCAERATSAMYADAVQGYKPEWEWWKPTDEEREKLISDFIATIPKDADHYDERVAFANYTFNYHFNNGGLEIRKIQNVTT